MTKTVGPYSQFESMREICGAELRGLHSQGDLGNEYKSGVGIFFPHGVAEGDPVQDDIEIGQEK